MRKPLRKNSVELCKHLWPRANLKVIPNSSASRAHGKLWVDERFDYRETRMIALAPKRETLYCVAFVDRGEVRRIISLRRANRREVKHYVENC